MGNWLIDLGKFIIIMVVLDILKLAHGAAKDLADIRESLDQIGSQLESIDLELFRSRKDNPFDNQ
jgi:hypothetical protein